MKCEACYTDNLNEATFCKGCGRNIRETYIKSSSKKAVMTIPILLCVALVTAACIICINKLGRLFAQKSVNSEQFTAVSAPALIYYDRSADTAYAYERDSAEGTHTAKKLYTGKKHETVEQGANCSVLRFENKLYFVSNGNKTELKDCSSYMLSKTQPAIAYLTHSGTLYTISDKFPASVDTHVMQYIISQDGSYVAYLRDDSAASENRPAQDKNAFYIDKTEMSIESQHGSELLCANAFGFYYKNAENKLILVLADKDSDKSKNTFSSQNEVSHIVAVGSNSVLYASTDGNTYLWNKSDEEKLFARCILRSMIIPEGFVFTGDDYTGIIYAMGDKKADAAVYIDKDGNCSDKLCTNAKNMAASGDFSFLYYKNGKNDIWRVSTDGAFSKTKCGHSKSQFIVSDDGRKIWYKDTDGLYEFDGMLTNRILHTNEIKDYTLSIYGYLLIDTKDCLLIYNNGELQPVLEDKTGITALECERACSYYIDKDGLHIAYADGTFKTDEEVSQENASGSADAEAE